MGFWWKLLGLIVFLAPSAAYSTGAAAPGGGTILQQIQSAPAPPQPSGGTGLTIEQELRGKSLPSKPFLVKSIHISGNTLFDSETLHALVIDAEGKNLDLSQLLELASRITDYYRSHGYPLARAIIPAQVIQDGVVVLEVIEARYGKINLNNGSHINVQLLDATLSPLVSGQNINQGALDSTLLLLSDMPGIIVNATLKPGETAGSSDLLVETASGPSVTGNISLDNYGYRYTGLMRIGGSVNLIEPLHHGDILSASGLDSGSGMNYGRFSYESLLNGQGTRLGASYSALHYVLGDAFAPLDAHGLAEVGSLWIRHPLVRSLDFNLYGQMQFDALQLSDRIDSSAIRTDRNLANGTVSIAGDGRDTYLSGGVNNWYLGWTAGHVDFVNDAAQMADATTARTQGDFSKVNVNFSRLQRLNSKNSLYIAFSGQWANTNLDQSQKMIAGGPYTVRAYDMGAVSGDMGYSGTAEYRRDLGTAWDGQWQAVTFIDSEHITVNKSTWVSGINSAVLSGAGVGLNWAGPDQWTAKSYVAARIGPLPLLASSSGSAHAWLEISKNF